MRNTRFSFSKFLVFLLLLGISVSSTASASKKNASFAPAYTPVNDWLYRGSQPEEKDLKEIKKKGVRTVVNFRNESKWIDWEREKVEALGMNYVSLPWSILKSAKPELLDEFFEALDKPENRPVYMHCKHGRDRTGVMTTLALMRYEGLTEEEARTQALETIQPNFRYRWFVNRKIDFFTEARSSEVSGSSAGDRKTAEPLPQTNVRPVAA